MSAAGAGARRGQSRPGLSRFRLAGRRRREGRRGADRRGRANIRRCAACPSCARRSPIIIARIRGSTLDPEQVIVTSGATEAIAASLIALIAPGDEVVLFQPLYDAYLPLVLRAGGVPRLVRLTPPGWRITEEALADAFTPRTRLVVFNNPHNPTARVFDARGAGAARRGLRARTTRSRFPTRSGSMSCSTAARTSRCRAARHGGADGQDRLGGQDLLADRLEGRLGGGAAGARRGRSPRRTSSSPSRRRPICRRAVAYGLGKDDGLFRRHARRLRRRRATRWPPALDGGGLSRRCRPRAPISSTSTSPRRASPRTMSTFCERAVREARRRGDPALGLLRGGAGHQRHPPLLRQEAGDARGGRRAAGQGAGAVRGLSGRNDTNHPRRGGHISRAPGHGRAPRIESGGRNRVAKSEWHARQWNTRGVFPRKRRLPARHRALRGERPAD